MAARKREAVPLVVKIQVLTEAGYRCAVPTCRGILALDLHHIVAVAEDGANTPDNLLALCPTCHALYERGTIKRESIQAWKMTLVALSNAFDRETVDKLIFLYRIQPTPTSWKPFGDPYSLILSGDGVVQFYKLIASDLAYAQQVGPTPYRGYLNSNANPTPVYYNVHLTDKGMRLLEAWMAGDREGIRLALVLPSQDDNDKREA